MLQESVKCNQSEPEKFRNFVCNKSKNSHWSESSRDIKRENEERKSVHSGYRDLDIGIKEGFLLLYPYIQKSYI